MKVQILAAAAVAVVFSAGVYAGESGKSGPAGTTDSSSANPATKGSPKTPAQPNETQPGMNSGNPSADMKGDAKGMRRDKSGSKGDGMGKGDSMSAGKGSSGMSSGSSNPGNPAEKGVRTPSQPNETQPGMGSNKK
jgi:hypothetical protein